MSPVNSIVIQNLHISGQKQSQPFRSVLITSKTLLEYWNIRPGSLRENIVVDDIDISELDSGDIIQIGKVQIRVTFNCEPCKKMLHVASVKELTGKRGVLGDFLNDGKISIGNNVQITEKKRYEPIPSEYFARIAWYLDEKVTGTIMATELLWNCGVAPGLIRVLPQVLAKHQIPGKNKVIFSGKKLNLYKMV